MATWAWILIVVVVVVLIGVIAAAVRHRKTSELRKRFGPEYDRVVESSQDQRSAEAELIGRERQRSRLEIKPLPEEARARYTQEWRDLQERFIDQPAEAVVHADALVHRVMSDRGYPMGDFDAQAGLISVDHPMVVDNYRFAHGVHERAQGDGASTEDLREALVRYRSLFDELLADNRDAEAVPAGHGAGGLGGRLGRRVAGKTTARGPAQTDEESEVSDERR